MVAGRVDDVALVDAFLAQDKFLSGPPPEFGPKPRGKAPSWEAAWPVANVSGIVESGSIRVRYAPASQKPFSLLLVFRDQCVYRLDFVDQNECHDNPQWARTLNVPQRVCGPHVHSWVLNREHIVRQDIWDLPCREPLQQQIRRFDQAFPWFSDEINVELRPEERNFDLPRELV